MTERHVVDQAVAYASGALDDAVRASVDAHLASCAECRAEYEAVRLALAALTVWPREPGLDPALEQRIVSSMRGAQSTRWLTRVAAGILITLAAGTSGFAIGRATARAANPMISTADTPPSTPSDTALRTFLLLLEEREWPPTRPLSRTGYGPWTRSIAAEQRFVGAQKLTDESGVRVQSDGQVAPPDRSERPPNISGWFIVLARDYDEAVEWARRGPHLRYGSVLVREVERGRAAPPPR